MSDVNVTINDAKIYIKNNIQNQINCLKKGIPTSCLFLQGPPGVGKSDVMHQIATEMGMGLNTQYLGTMLIEAFGMPLPTMEKDSKFQKWSAPEFYRCDNLAVDPINDESYIILFLDDIHLASKTISNYLFQLLLGRSIHNKKLPDNFVLILAGNRPEDRANANTLASPIINRLFSLEVKADAEEWIKNFAIPNNIRQDIISFIELYPECLQSEPLENKAWASPRSWVYFSNELVYFRNSDIDDIMRIGSGHIGIDYTIKFNEYVQLFRKWQSEKYLNGSEPLPIFQDLNHIETYTFMASLTSRLLKNIKDKNWNIDEKLSSQIEVMKSTFNDIIKVVPEIVPLGLRSLILSESISNNKAKLFYKLTEKNPTLTAAVKEIIN